VAAHVTRVALVTGGNRGIGRAIAEAFARDGAAVCISGRDEAALEEAEQALRTAGAAVAAVAGDVSRPPDVEHVVAAAEELGTLEVVVNNAAAAGATAPVHEFPVEDFVATLATNLTGPFLVCRRALPGMIERGGGSIVNIGSIAGVRGYPLRSPYAASKWGLVGLTRTLAGEVGPHGIRVNLVAPGPTRGERSETVIRRRAEALGRPVDELEREYRDSIPLRRFVEPEEVASTVLFLCSPAAAGITGQSFSVSGGIDA
jgi:NAD(P)-dependent dehydrogenase (short-subunit alcohol dehydrogenase family)